jgi:DNA-binding NarL/FixJ family response regulator
MPRRDGEQTFIELKRIRPDVLVVLMSGFNQAEATARFVANDLSGFLSKPFTSDTLTETIRKALE